MIDNIEPVNGNATYPTATVGGSVAPSCYRVSLLSGSLEITARLKNGDDLELLLKVLEANKILFARADRLAAEVLTLTQELGGGAQFQPQAEPTALAKCSQDVDANGVASIGE